MTSEPTFAVPADISESHRQVSTDRQDWHQLDCQARSVEDVLASTAGNFCVASARYFWSLAVGRLCQNIAGTSARTCHLLVADDYHEDAAVLAFREASFVFFVLCSKAGLPLSLSKTAGGEPVSWVGFGLLHPTHMSDVRSGVHNGSRSRRGKWKIPAACI